MTGARTWSTFDWVDSRRTTANSRIVSAGTSRLPARRVRPSGAPTPLAVLQSRLEACLTALRTRHRTTCACRRPINSGPHRPIVRPRERRGLRLISSEVNVTPAGALAWAKMSSATTLRPSPFSPGRTSWRSMRPRNSSFTPQRGRCSIQRLRRSYIPFDIRTTNGPIWARQPSNTMPTRTGVCGDGREILSAAIGQTRSLFSRISAPAFPAG